MAASRKPLENIPTQFFEDELFATSLSKKCLDPTTDPKWRAVCKQYNVSDWPKDICEEDPVTQELIPIERQLRLRVYNAGSDTYKLKCFDIEQLKIIWLFAMLDYQDKHRILPANVDDIPVKNPNGDVFGITQVRRIRQHPYRIEPKLYEEYKRSHQKGLLESKRKQETSDIELSRELEQQDIKASAARYGQQAYDYGAGAGAGASQYYGAGAGAGASAAGQYYRERNEEEDLALALEESLYAPVNHDRLGFRASAFAHAQEKQVSYRMLEQQAKLEEDIKRSAEIKKETDLRLLKNQLARLKEDVGPISYQLLNPTPDMSILKLCLMKKESIQEFATRLRSILDKLRNLNLSPSESDLLRVEVSKVSKRISGLNELCKNVLK